MHLRCSSTAMTHGRRHAVLYWTVLSSGVQENSPTDMVQDASRYCDGSRKEPLGRCSHHGCVRACTKTSTGPHWARSVRTNTHPSRESEPSTSVHILYCNPTYIPPHLSSLCLSPRTLSVIRNPEIPSRSRETDQSPRFVHHRFRQYISSASEPGAAKDRA